MKALHLLIIPFLAFHLSGCGDSGKTKIQATSTAGKRNLRGPVNGTAVVSQDGTQKIVQEPSASSAAWGRIFKFKEQSQADYQNAVVDFLSPQLSREEIGEVSGDFESTKTGIAFYGKGIKFKDNASGTQGVFNADTAELRLVVYDSKVGSESEEEILREIPIHFNSGANSGKLIDSLYIAEQNFIQLVFEDAYGKLSIEGVVQEKEYFGLVRYRNLMDKDGKDISSNSQTKDLGRFIVPACSFFNVNQIGSITCN